jgi:hypothetical protein
MNCIHKCRDGHASYFEASRRTKEIMRICFVDEHYAQGYDFTRAYNDHICCRRPSALYEYARGIIARAETYATEYEIARAVEYAMRYYPTKFDEEYARLRRRILVRTLESKLRPCFVSRVIGYTLPGPIAEPICDALIVHRLG